MQNSRLLDQFGVDLVATASSAGRIIGRQKEIETVLRILSRKQKNNPALRLYRRAGFCVVRENDEELVMERRF